MRGVNDSMVTINAAASAIHTAENRGTQSSSVQKRRWGSCWNLSWCFGSRKHSKRVGRAVVPEPSSLQTEPLTAINMSQTPSIVLPFIAPPSSPASFLQSESPFAAHSPGGFLPFTSMSASMYSPGGPANMFAVGPYAHETQLVSPPVFSTYTTEPSTAPFTPPPESIYLTTPSSPEVPYALLLGLRGPNDVIPNEFGSYQLYPGSPMGHLISPGSGFSNSGSSSPFPEGPDGVGDGFHMGLFYGGRNEDLQHLVNHRVSFEVTPEQVVRCVERKRSADMATNRDFYTDEVVQNHRSTTTLGSIKEFNFDSSDGVESDWWTCEKILGKENGPIKNWSFFPMMQTGFS